MRKLSLDETEKHFKLGIEKAREFFQVPDEIKIILSPRHSPEDVAADIEWDATSLRGRIRVNIYKLSSGEEDIWETAGHEVAHMVSRELLAMRNRKSFPAEIEDEFMEYLEMCTIRLEQLFLRHCPDPGEELYGKA